MSGPATRLVPRVAPLVALLAAMTACGAPPAGHEVPPHRASDGLLGDRELQEVVERQVRRDVQGLIEALAHPRPEVRARAAFALGSVQAPDAVDALLAALDDAEATVRRDAAFALGQLGAVDLAPVLSERFAGEGDPVVRRHILEALGKVRVRTAAAALASLAVPPELEAARTMALATLGGARSVTTTASQDLLLAHLDNSDTAVREAAAYYFGRLPQAAPWAERSARVREALDGYAKDDPAAMYLVHALGKLGDAADHARLAEWAASAQDWRIRANAMAALTRENLDPETREVLLGGLGDPSEHVALQAAQALARSTPSASEVRQLEAWIDANPARWQVSDPLLTLLARVDEREYVLAWLDHLAPDDVQRWGVGLRALAALPGEEAMARLGRAARSESPGLAGEAVEALARRWVADRADSRTHTFYLGVFSHAARSGNVRAAHGAALALADSAFSSYGSTDTLAAAWGTMSSPRDLEAMVAVLEALGETGAPEAGTVLREGLGHEHPALREAAARALTALTGREVPTPSAPEGSEDEAPTDGDPGRLDWGYLSRLGTAPRLVLETERGRVVVRLATEEAPHTVQTIARLAEEGRYDGVPFHRVVPNFVAQGGDFSSGDGFGGPGFTITSEFTLIPFRRGVIGMASAGKDTEGSQFFLTHSMQPHLDGAYTSFGWVVVGMNVVDRILVGDRILRATIERGR